MTRRIVGAAAMSLALASFIHLDWHFARPTHHRLSLGLSWHWLLAVPVFALVAWYVARVWSSHLVRASTAIIGGAVLIGGVLEPAWEYRVDGAPVEWAFGMSRNLILATFVGTGLVTYAAFLTLAARRRFPNEQR